MVGSSSEAGQGSRFEPAADLDFAGENFILIPPLLPHKV